MSYPQSLFWGNDELTGSHGISYFNNIYRDPYKNRIGAFNDVKSPSASAYLNFSSYNRALYFTYENK